MLTDSRSFMSYPRHEYFRRVLCNLLGREMESGELPADDAMIGAMVEKDLLQERGAILRAHAVITMTAQTEAEDTKREGLASESVARESDTAQPVQLSISC